MTVLLALLTFHFIGDFLLQSNHQALNKSKSTIEGLLALTAHANTYALTFAVGIVVCLWPFNELWYSIDWSRYVAFLGLTFVTHWITDFVTSRWTSRLWFVDLTPFYRYEPQIEASPTCGEPFYVKIDERRRHWFFVVIGLDQLIHVWTLALTYLWCIR